jgi:hypothetical protein
MIKLLRIKPPFFLLILMALLITGCTQVQPWEKGILAKKEMQLNPDLVNQQLDDHIYFSKEGSNGTNTPAGGGCGCN